MAIYAGKPPEPQPEMQSQENPSIVPAYMEGHAQVLPDDQLAPIEQMLNDRDR